MPQTITERVLIATKLASGDVQLVFQTAVGGIQYAVVMPSADVTSLNTTVNGGSTGASITIKYNHNQNQGEYPPGYKHSGGN